MLNIEVCIVSVAMRIAKKYSSGKQKQDVHIMDEQVKFQHVFSTPTFILFSPTNYLTCPHYTCVSAAITDWLQKRRVW